jgi:hypothetical protein
MIFTVHCGCDSNMAFKAEQGIINGLGHTVNSNGEIFEDKNIFGSLEQEVVERTILLV